MNQVVAWRVRMVQALVAGSLMLGLASQPVRAQSEASLLLSALPVASVVGGTAALSALPVALSVGGAVLVVKTAEVSAHGTVWVLARVSDGAEVSVELSGRTAHAASVATGTLVAVSVIGTGVVLSVAGELLCFIPNELGRGLFHHERLSH